MMKAFCFSDLNTKFRRVSLLPALDIQAEVIKLFMLKAAAYDSAHNSHSAFTMFSLLIYSSVSAGNKPNALVTPQAYVTFLDLGF